MGWLLAFLGGGIGSALRLGVGRLTLLHGGAAFPWGTLIVNVVGSFLIGLAVFRLEGVGEDARTFLVTGLLGGFTTFSAFSLDALTLYQRGDGALALGYVAATLVLGLGAAMLGMQLAR